MNNQDSDPINNIRCEIESSFPLDKDSLAKLNERGLRSLAPKADLYFLIGSIIEILAHPEPTITFKFNYEFRSRLAAQSAVFHLGDLDRTAIIKSPTERSLEEVGKKIDKVSDQLERLNRSIEMLSSMSDATGLRVSYRTLRASSNAPQLLNPREYDFRGYAIIADISEDEALLLYRVFNRAGAKREHYEQINAETRRRFEKYFRIDDLSS